LQARACPPSSSFDSDPAALNPTLQLGSRDARCPSHESVEPRAA
jgi:hypothetical protein